MGSNICFSGVRMPRQAAWQKGRVISSRVYFATRAPVTTIRYKSSIDGNIYQVQTKHEITVLEKDEIEISGPSPARLNRIKDLSQEMDYDNL